MRNQKTSICFLLVVLLLDTFGNGMIQAQTSNESTASSNLTAADRTDLQRQLATLESTVKGLAARSDPKIKSHLPDVQLYSQAVALALDLNEFYSAADTAKAKELLQEGRTRADQLLKGESPWTTATRSRGAAATFHASTAPYNRMA